MNKKSILTALALVFSNADCAQPFYGGNFANQGIQGIGFAFAPASAPQRVTHRFTDDEDQLLWDVMTESYGYDAATSVLGVEQFVRYNELATAAGFVARTDAYTLQVRWRMLTQPRRAITAADEAEIIRLQGILGNQWTQIAGSLEITEDGMVTPLQVNNWWHSMERQVQRRRG